MGNIINETAIIFDNSDSIERNKKEQEYLDYINEHISLVGKAFVLYMIPMYKMNNISSYATDEDIKNAIRYVAENIETHDASKFSDSEFDGYRAKWYPTSRELEGDDIYKGSVDERYEECWKHHYETNDHHPKHWLNPETGDPEDMSLHAIIEMLCDWEAMSLKFGTSVLEWYENEAVDEKKCLSTNTKEIVEDLLYNVMHK